MEIHEGNYGNKPGTKETRDVFDLKRRYADRMVYDIKSQQERLREQMVLYAFESLSHCFNVIQWSVCAAQLQVEHT